MNPAADPEAAVVILDGNCGFCVTSAPLHPDRVQAFTDRCPHPARAATTAVDGGSLIIEHEMAEDVPTIGMEIAHHLRHPSGTQILRIPGVKTQVAPRRPRTRT